MSVITYIVVLSVSLLSAPYAQADAPQCAHNALLWCSELRHENLSQEDKVLLLNLTYWSWARSEMILQAQKAVESYIHNAHAFIQKGMSGRMNPARLCSIAGCSRREWARIAQAYEDAHEVLVEKLRAHHYASATYAQCIEYILKMEKASPVVVAYTQKLREQARTCLLETASSHATSLTDVMATLRKVFDCIHLGTHTRGLFDVVFNFANSDVFNSYAKFDKQYTQCNDVVWGTLERSYALGNIMWDITESERTRFYGVYHRMLVRAFQDNGSEEMMSAFNPDGFVPLEQRTHPITLKSR